MCEVWEMEMQMLVICASETIRVFNFHIAAAGYLRIFSRNITALVNWYKNVKLLLSFLFLPSSGLIMVLLWHQSTDHTLDTAYTIFSLCLIYSTINILKIKSERRRGVK